MSESSLALWTDTAGDADIEPDNQFVEPWDQDDVLFDNIESCLVFQNLNTVNTVMKKKEQLEQQQNTRLGRLRDRPRPISDFSEILCRIAKKHTVDDDDSDLDYRMHNRTIVEIIPGTAAGGSTANLDLPSKPGTSFHAQDMPLCFQNVAKRSSLVANGSSTDQRRSESAGAFRKMSVESDALHQIKSSQQVSAAASKSIQEWRSQKAEAVLTMKRLKNVFPATNFRLPPPSHYYQVYDPKHSSSSSSFDKKQLIKDKNFWDDLTGERQKPNFQASKKEISPFWMSEENIERYPMERSSPTKPQPVYKRNSKTGLSKALESTNSQIKAITASTMKKPRGSISNLSLSSSIKALSFSFDN